MTSSNHQNRQAAHNPLQTLIISSSSAKDFGACVVAALQDRFKHVDADVHRPPTSIQLGRIALLRIHLEAQQESHKASFYCAGNAFDSKGATPAACTDSQFAHLFPRPLQPGDIGVGRTNSQQPAQTTSRDIFSGDERHSQTTTGICKDGAVG